MAYIEKKKNTKTRVPTLKNNEYSKIYNDRRWKTLRARTFAEFPLCVLCLEEGKTTPTQEIHHIVKFSDVIDEISRKKLAFSPLNVIALCIECHKKVHMNYVTDYELKETILTNKKPNERAD